MPRLLSALPLLFIAACAGVGPAGSMGSALEGAFVGSLVVERQPFHTTMTLEATDPGRSEGDFDISAPVDADGHVQAVVIDDLVRMTMTYREPDGCEGRIEGILTVERNGSFFEGPVTVIDCDAEVPGRLSMRRR